MQEFGRRPPNFTFDGILEARSKYIALLGARADRARAEEDRHGDFYGLNLLVQIAQRDYNDQIAENRRKLKVVK